MLISGSELIIGINIKGIKHWLRPMEEPTVPQAVPRRFASTTKDTDVDKDA